MSSVQLSVRNKKIYGIFSKYWSDLKLKKHAKINKLLELTFQINKAIITSLQQNTFHILRKLSNNNNQHI